MNVIRLIWRIKNEKGFPGFEDYDLGVNKICNFKESTLNADTLGHGYVYIYSNCITEKLAVDRFSNLLLAIKILKYTENVTTKVKTNYNLFMH